MLKGEAKTKHQRDYMRKRRAELRTRNAAPATKPAASPDKPQADPELQARCAAWQAENQALKAELAKLESDVAKPDIDRASLSMSAQERLDAAIRQHKKALELSFHDAVNARVKEFLEDTILPQHRKEQEMSKRVMNARKGIMDKDTFKSIWRALHPDSRNSISDKKLAEAFDRFAGLEKLLLSEKDSPTKFSTIPKDWDELKRQASEQRKAARQQAGKAKEMARR